ncbi:MAG: hypothetical protein E7624_01850 [Ruminococcaceae bacterium]|nr:hypothetical protein [Oscillospiraceae bacterium]
MQFLILLAQILFLGTVPVLFFGLILWLIRHMIIFLLGGPVGRKVQKFLFACTAPVRAAGHVMAAVLFWHRVERVRFLRWNAPDGELAFVEHSYHPRNPVALLGNFFYALTPAFLSLALTLAVFLLCFDGVTQGLVETVSALEGSGSFVDYARAAWGLLPAMFSSMKEHAALKILGALLLLLLSMGAFVSLRELVDAFTGILLYVGAALLCCGVLFLLDARVRRVALGALRAFATGVTALFLPLLLAALALLAFAAIFYLVRKLYAVPGEEDAESELAEKR